jgi:hypothetical protein
MKNANTFEISFQLRSGSCDPANGLGEHIQQVGRIPRVTQVLALAMHFDDMIRQGVAKDYADVARLAGLCRERISKVMRLTYLAPEIQVELLYLPPTPTGRYPISETCMRRIASLLSWPDQRQQWECLKAHHRLECTTHNATSSGH